jgi:hypothetical protein
MGTKVTITNGTKTSPMYWTMGAVPQVGNIISFGDVKGVVSIVDWTHTNEVTVTVA